MEMGGLFLSVTREEKIKIRVYKEKKEQRSTTPSLSPSLNSNFSLVPTGVGGLPTYTLRQIAETSIASMPQLAFLGPRAVSLAELRAGLALHLTSPVVGVPGWAQPVPRRGRRVQRLPPHPV